MVTSVIIALVLFALALVIIVTSAYFLVGALLAITQRIGLSSLVVGLLVLSVGNSLPEFVTALAANMKGLVELGMGAVLASPFVSMTLVVGMIALFSSSKIDDPVERKLISFTAVPPILLFLFAFNGTISRVEGALLLLVFAAFQWYVYKQGVSVGKIVKLKTVVLHYVAIPIAVIGLVIAGFLLVDTGQFISLAFGIPTAVVGLVIVSFATALPDMASGIAGIIKKESSVGVGNVLGGNVFDLLFVFGFISLIKPLVFNFEWFRFSLIVALVANGIFVAYVHWVKRIDKWLGISLIGCYIVFLCVNLL